MELHNSLEDLKSPRPSQRGMAAFNLRDSFSEVVGALLIEMIIAETNVTAFTLACGATLPKWIVKLEQSLATRTAWPIGATNTAFLVRTIRGLRLPSYERFLSTFLDSPDLCLKLSAAQYCHEKHVYVEEARSACADFLAHGKASGAENEEVAGALGYETHEQLSKALRRIVADLQT